MTDKIKRSSRGPWKSHTQKSPETQEASFMLGVSTAVQLGLTVPMGELGSFFSSIVSSLKGELEVEIHVNSHGV